MFSAHDQGGDGGPASSGGGDENNIAQVCWKRSLDRPGFACYDFRVQRFQVGGQVGARLWLREGIERQISRGESVACGAGKKGRGGLCESMKSRPETWERASRTKSSVGPSPR